MGDEQHGQTELGIDALQQFENGLCRFRIERRRCFVGKQQLRLGGERTGNADTLLLAAGKFRRITLCLIGQANKIEQRRNPGLDILLAHA